MPTLSNNLYYPAFAITMFIFMLTLVPRKEIKSLFWFSLIWGPGVDLSLILLFRFLKFYNYVNAKPFDFYGAPLLLVLAWSPAIILFLYFMPKRVEWYVYPLYLGAFGTIGTFVGVFLHNAGLIEEIHWNELFRTPFIIAWLHFAAWHYSILKSRDDRMV
jgi:hypothetical protein